MNAVITSLACGLAFGMGVTSWLFIATFATRSRRDKQEGEFKAHYKRVEDRLEVQVATMSACLSAIEKGAKK